MQVQEFLEALWPDGLENRWLVLWVKSTTGRSRPFFYRSIDQAVKQAEKLPGQLDVYYGVGLLKARPARGRGRKQDVAAVPGLWADLDVAGEGHKGEGQFPSVEAALAFLRNLPLPPSIVVATGGGLHAYWLFHEPLVIGEDGTLEEIQHKARRWQDALRTKTDYEVDTTHDLSRLLRLPGFKNQKYGKTVEILETSDRRYSPDDLEDWADEVLGADTGPMLTESESDDTINRFQSAAARLRLSPDLLEAELLQIPPQGYNGWIRVGMALHHETEGAAWGLKLWDKWSALDQRRYKGKADLVTHWRSFNCNQPREQLVTWSGVRAGAAAPWSALVARAKTDGDLLAILQSVTDIGPLEGDILVKKVAARAKELGLKGFTISACKRERARLTTSVSDRVQAVADTHIYIKTFNRYVCTDDFSLIHKDALRTILRPLGVKLEDLETMGRIRQYDRLEYLPGKPEEVQRGNLRIYNRWQPWPRLSPEEVKAAKARHAQGDDPDIAFILEHYREVMGEDFENVMLPWMATIYRQPGVKFRWAPVLVGDQNTGKTMLLTAFGRLLGESNIVTPGNDALTRDFNPWVEDGVVAVFEEVKQYGVNKEATINKIKSYITDVTVSVHRKGIDAYDVRNVINLAFTSNFEDCLHFSEGERRFALIACDGLARIEGRYDRLWQAMVTNGGLQRLLEISPIVGEPDCPVVLYERPESREFEEITKLNRSPEAAVLADAVESMMDEKGWVASSRLRNILEAAAKRNTAISPSPANFGRAMRELGFKRKTNTDGGRGIRGWFKPREESDDGLFFGDTTGNQEVC